MKLVQKILSHSLLIAFIATAVFIYIKRVELLPQWFGKTEKTIQQTKKEKPDTSDLPVQLKSSINIVSAEPEVEDTPDQVQQESLENKAMVVAGKALVTEDQAETETMETLSTPEPAPGQKPALTEEVLPEPEQEVLPEKEKQQEKDLPVAVKDVVTQQQTDTAEPAKAFQPPSVSGPDREFQKQLNEARRYFWQHNLPAAAAAYQLLAEAYPENPDVWGEIGNFYFTLQQRKPVIKSYSRSVQLLIKQGKLVPARQLINVLYRLGAPRVREFEMQIQQVGG